MSELFLWIFVFQMHLEISRFIRKSCLDVEYDCIEFTDFSNVETLKNWHLPNMYNLFIREDNIESLSFGSLLISF